jgi:hypothetical protein
MKESDTYYRCYEKLMRETPEKPLVEVPEYKNLAERYPHIARSIELRKEIERLDKGARSATKRSTRVQMRRQIDRLSAELKQQGTLKRLRGESKQENDFRIRFTIDSLKRRLSSLALGLSKVCFDLQEKVQEQSRKSRRARAERLPPSLFDLRSLDPADKSLALTEWIEKRKVQIR